MKNKRIHRKFPDYWGWHNGSSLNKYIKNSVLNIEEIQTYKQHALKLKIIYCNFPNEK